MYLLSKTQTILLGAVLVSLYGLLCSFIIDAFAKESVGDLLFGFGSCVVYAFFGLEYYRAFKRRMYDRSYHKAKNAFQDAFTAYLPVAGKTKFVHEGVKIYARRDAKPPFSDFFSLFVVKDREESYDEETLARVSMVSMYCYSFRKSFHHVDKSYSVIVLRSVKELGSSELTRTTDPEPVISNRQKRLALRKTPEALRWASIDEIDELTALLVDEKKGIVS